MQLFRVLFFSTSFFFFFAGGAGAQTCPPYPNTLTNGTTADANAVMGNFNAILNCANANLAPSSGGTLNNTTLNGTTIVQKLQFPDGTTQSSASSLAVSVRQTVMAGPAASGAPTFLPGTSSSLTLTAQNVSSASPLALTASQGYGATGPTNYIYQFTSNPSWTLPASTTVYLYVNAQTGATSVQTLQPIYQYGGTISTASGQFTFDYQAMIGYLGNGSATVATPLVCVGEAVTGASSVTSTIAYAYNGFYDSGFTNTLPGASMLITKSANLGVVAGKVELVLMNLTAENGYTPGDIVYQTGQYDGTYVRPTQTFATRNTAGFSTTSNTGFSIYAKTVSSVPNVPADWAYKIVARRGWGGA